MAVLVHHEYYSVISLINSSASIRVYLARLWGIYATFFSFKYFLRVLLIMLSEVARLSSCVGQICASGAHHLQNKSCLLPVIILSSSDQKQKVFGFFSVSRNCMLNLQLVPCVDFGFFLKPLDCHKYTVSGRYPLLILLWKWQVQATKVDLHIIVLRYF